MSGDFFVGLVCDFLVEIIIEGVLLLCVFVNEEEVVVLMVVIDKVLVVLFLCYM